MPGEGGVLWSEVRRRAAAAFRVTKSADVFL